MVAEVGSMAMLELNSVLVYGQKCRVYFIPSQNVQYLRKNSCRANSASSIYAKLAGPFGCRLFCFL